MNVCQARLLERLQDFSMSVFRQPIDAGAHEELRPKLFTEAEYLVDVAVPIADMYEPVGAPEQFG